MPRIINPITGEFDETGVSQSYVDTLVSSVMKLQGDWNASTNSPNISSTTQIGYTWRVSVDGATNIGGITDWKVGDMVVKTASGWMKIDNTNISYVPEDVANKETSALDTSTTKYPCNNVVKTAVDAKLALSGGTMSGTLTVDTLQLGEKSVKLDAALSGAGTRSGITIAGTGGETLAFGDLCYYKASDSKWYKAKADVTGTSGAVKLGMCVLAGASTTTEMLLLGKIYKSSTTAGALYYVSAATAGAATATQPTGTTGFVIRTIGYGDSTTELYFNPSNDYIEI